MRKQTHDEQFLCWLYSQPDNREFDNFLTSCAMQNWSVETFDFKYQYTGILSSALIRKVNTAALEAAGDKVYAPFTARRLREVLARNEALAA